MPLVFVHGVNVRNDGNYYERENVRNGLFRRISLNGILTNPSNALINNPYWGKYGAKFAWNHASLPRDDYEAFGLGGDVFEEIIHEVAPGIEGEPNRFIIAIAQSSLIKAVDIIWAASANTKSDLGQDVAGALSVMGWKALNYAEANPKPNWLQIVSNDDQFIDQLLNAIEAWTPIEKNISMEDEFIIESFGIKDTWNHVKTAATNLGLAIANLPGKAAGLVSTPIVNATRPWAHHRFSLFLGDVFEYLSTRGSIGSEGPIVKTVGDSFQAAVQAKKPGSDEQFIIVAHSMGGNIAYDILTHFLPDIECDLLVTVASQVGLFEELKLFQSSDRTIPSPTQKLVEKPKNIKRWLNIFDPIDVLGYATSRIFSDSVDYKFATDTLPMSAHSMYFYRPSFHKRLRERIKGYMS